MVLYIFFFRTVIFQSLVSAAFMFYVQHGHMYVSMFGHMLSLIRRIVVIDAIKTNWAESVFFL